MKKIHRFVGEAKIAMKEKTGHKENTTEPPSIKRQTKNIEDAWIHLKDITRKMEKHAKSNRFTIEDNFLTAQAFKDYGTKLDNDGDFISLAAAFTSIGVMQGKIEDLKMRFDDSLNTKVVSPFQNFVKTQIKEAREEKVKYDKMRISYDAAYEKVKQMKQKGSVRPEKLAEAEKELETIENQFGEVGEDIVSTQEQVIGMHQFHSLYKLCDFIILYRDFFQQGLEIVNSVFPVVEEYKQAADQFKGRFSQMMRTHANKQEKVNIFSMALQDLCARENRTVPYFLEKIIRHLMQESCLETEGLFRVSGSQREVMEMKKAIEGGALPDFSTQVSDHNVAGLLKLYLRELPEPLVPFQMYDSVVQVCTMDTENVPEKIAEKVESIRAVFESLPPPNQAIIRLLLGLCSKITEHSTVNLMNSRNLSVVLAPNLLYSQEVNLTALSDANASIEFCISHFDMIYPSFEQNMFAGCGDPATKEEKPPTVVTPPSTIAPPIPTTTTTTTTTATATASSTTSTTPATPISPQKTPKSPFFSPQTPRLGATRKSVLVTLDPSFQDAIKNIEQPATATATSTSPTNSPSILSSQQQNPSQPSTSSPIDLPSSSQSASSSPLNESTDTPSPEIQQQQLLPLLPPQPPQPPPLLPPQPPLPPPQQPLPTRVGVTKALGWRNAKNFPSDQP